MVPVLSVCCLAWTLLSTLVTALPKITYHSDTDALSSLYSLTNEIFPKDTKPTQGVDGDEVAKILFKQQSQSPAEHTKYLTVLHKDVVDGDLVFEILFLNQFKQKMRRNELDELVPISDDLEGDGYLAKAIDQTISNIHKLNKYVTTSTSKGTADIKMDGRSERILNSQSEQEIIIKDGKINNENSDSNMNSELQAEKFREDLILQVQRFSAKLLEAVKNKNSTFYDIKSATDAIVKAANKHIESIRHQLPSNKKKTPYAGVIRIEIDPSDILDEDISKTVKTQEEKKTFADTLVKMLENNMKPWEGVSDPNEAEQEGDKLETPTDREEQFDVDSAENNEALDEGSGADKSRVMKRMQVASREQQTSEEGNQVTTVYVIETARGNVSVKAENVPADLSKQNIVFKEPAALNTRISSRAKHREKISPRRFMQNILKHKMRRMRAHAHEHYHAPMYHPVYTPVVNLRTRITPKPKPLRRKVVYLMPMKRARATTQNTRGDVQLMKHTKQSSSEDDSCTHSSDDETSVSHDESSDDVTCTRHNEHVSTSHVYSEDSTSADYSSDVDSSSFTDQSSSYEDSVTRHSLQTRKRGNYKVLLKIRYRKPKQNTP